MAAADTQAILQLARAHQERGRLSQAEQICRQVLAQHPNQPQALHLLGVLAGQCGHHDQALELIGRAVAADPNSVDANFNFGIIMATRGDHAKAAEAFRATIRLKPGFAEAYSNLGVALANLGRVDEAIAAFRTAVQLRPDYADARINLGAALQQHGRPDEALAACQQAIKLRPDFATAHNNLGNALMDLGRYDQAIVAFNRAIELEPGLGVSHSNLGGALQKHGRPGQALAACQRAIELRPGFAEAHGNLGNALMDLSRYDQAVVAFNRAIELKPGLGMSHSNLGAALQKHGRPDQALAACQRAISLNPNLAMAHCNLGAALEDMGQLDAASTALRRALDLDPNLALAHCNLGVVLRAQGQLNEAQAAFRTALRLQPNLAHAHAHLATLLRGTLPAADRQALDACLANGSLVSEPRARLLFGLAHVLDATGDYARAADCLRQANALDLEAAPHRGHQYQPAQHQEFVDAVLEMFNPEFFARTRGAGSASPRPVFVFGLPRSGTTLVEQILASHPQVHGAGELHLVRHLFDAIPGAVGRSGQPLSGISGLDAQAIGHLAQQHLDKLHALDNGRAARIVDKMPDNYMFLGLLATLFPQATLIHCRRDLRDVAVSCWMTDFSSVPWANDPEHLVTRFAQYRRLMNHWNAVLPVPICDVDYEEVVGDLEGQARRLVAACGLEWDSACLEFHQTRRSIRTASDTLVRQPIYNRSVARWKNYEHELAELFVRLPPG